MDGYREAEKQLAEGLSPGARYTLGIAMVLIGIIPMMTAEGAQRPAAVYGVGVFCWVIAVACFAQGTARRLAGRIIGAVVFLACVAYLVSQITSGPVDSGSQAEPSVVNAIMAMVVFGFPGAYYAWKGKLRDAEEQEPTPPSEA